MSLRRFIALCAVLGVLPVGVAIGAHVAQVDPATVPIGFMAAHNSIDNVPMSAIARAAAARGAEMYVQHASLGPNGATSWHTHPGPVLVAVVSGSLTYEDAHAGQCRRRTYTAGQGFVDPGFGHVHRAVAGASGAHFYPVYVLPHGSPNHLIPSPIPAPCA
jgi:quercetin dioxygenase-like cupin family protein